MGQDESGLLPDDFGAEGLLRRFVPRVRAIDLAGSIPERRPSEKKNCRTGWGKPDRSLIFADSRKGFGSSGIPASFAA
jgi:hypothetical protein